MKNTAETVMEQGTAPVETSTEVVKPAKAKIPLIPTPVEPTSRKPLNLRFHVGKDFIRTFSMPARDGRQKPIQVYRLAPLLSEWQGRVVPDSINPRSHDSSTLKSPVAKQIEETIMERPEDFFLANRGITLVAESVEFDPKDGFVEIKITDPERHGLADGASTDSVIAKIQTRLARELLEKKDASWADLVATGKIPEVLKSGRVNVEILVGLDDRFRLSNLVEGRNISKQVRSWSLSDFRGAFDWMKEILEADDSPVKGKVGYEENSNSEISILDILALITLFHPEFDAKNESGADRTPTLAYATRGKLDQRLLDPKLSEGYKDISPLIIDIIKLHDTVYSTFDKSYDKVFGERSRLGRRDGITSKLLDDPHILPMTGAKSNYIIPSGFLWPILGAFRSLITRRAGRVYWKTDPYVFWDKYGKNLVGELFEQAAEFGGKPNAVGKASNIYSSLHKEARILLNEELEEKREAKEKGNSK